MSIRSFRLPRYALAAERFAALAAGMSLVLAFLVVYTAPASSATISILNHSVQPATLVDSDRDSVELGIKFSSSGAGSISALQFYRSSAQTRSYTGSLWSASGTRLATASFPASSVVGWQTAKLTKVVPVAKGQTLVASYYAIGGEYAATNRAFTSSYTANGFTVPVNGGVYRYGSVSGFPTESWEGSNYFVDVVFTPSASVSTSPGPTQVAPPPTSSTTTANAGWTVTASKVGLAPFGLSCAKLPKYTGSYRVPAGARISGKLIPTGLDLSAGDIVIDKSCIQPTSVGMGMPVLATTNYNTMKITTRKVVIRNSEIDGSKLDSKSAAMSTAFIGIADLDSNYVHGFGSGIGMMNTGTSLDALVERNYVTGLVAWGDPATTGNHSDAFTIRDFTDAARADRQIVVRNNRFNCASDNDTGALFIQTYSGRIDNVLIVGNLLEGNNYQLQLGQLNYPYSNIRADNNRMSGTGYGALSVQGGPGFARFTRNYIYSASAFDGKGKAIV